MHGIERVKTSGLESVLGVVVDVRKRARGAQEVEGIAVLQRLELAPHAAVLFDGRLEAFFERRNTLLIVVRRSIR